MATRREWRWMLSVLVLGLVGCGRVDKDLSLDPKFSHVMGKSYNLKLEMGVYRQERDKTLVIRPFGRSPLPDRQDVKTFPYRHDDLIVLGILPAQTMFRVVRVKEEGSTGMSFIRYYVEITKSSAQEWAGKVMYAGVTTMELIPKFKPEYVEELP